MLSISTRGSKNGKRPIVSALEDTIAVATYTFVGSLIATGSEFPPSGQVLYGVGLASLFAGMTSYLYDRRISIRNKREVEEDV